MPKQTQASIYSLLISYCFATVRFMRPSKLRHPLAVLRGICQMGQKEMADLVKCATITIQKIENRGLDLSEGLARRISHETGAPLDWLLNGDPSKPAIGFGGRPYTRESFDRFRARKTPHHKVIDELLLPAYALSCHVTIRAIAESAHKRSADFQLFRYKLDLVLKDMAKEFGESKSISTANPVEVVCRDLNETEANARTLLDMAKRMMAITPPALERRSRGRQKA
jgi:DNA-binding XRE family transcriptional regulator